MILLIFGLLLWSFAHFFKRLAPPGRAAMQDKMGDASKGVIAILLVISIVLMVIGYRSAPADFLWGRSVATTGINNLLMLAAVALFGLGSSKSRLRKKMRHPMLTGVVVWSASHLLVNGDTASIVLFGGLAIWAVAEMILINRAEPDYTPYDGGSAAGDIRLGIITLVIYSIIAGIHTWLGYFPFGG
ncbi:MAG: NnrU family protein [Boseongicola sp.]|nr:NnrU family protein [Boseongicola sp.]